jgi:hypothetical protein
MREGKFDISPNVERIMRKTLGKKNTTESLAGES